MPIVNGPAKDYAETESDLEWAFFRSPHPSIIFVLVGGIMLAIGLAIGFMAGIAFGG